MGHTGWQMCVPCAHQGSSQVFWSAGHYVSQCPGAFGNCLWPLASALHAFLSQTPKHKGSLESWQLRWTSQLKEKNFKC